MAERRSFANPVVQLGQETGTQLRLMGRTPLSVLSTVLLPLALLPLIHALNPHVEVTLPASLIPGSFDYVQYSAPAVAAFAVACACFANLAIRTAIAREQGVLKRVRGTPLPPAVHLGGRLLSNVLVALVIVVATLLMAVVVFDFELETSSLLSVAAIVLLGAAVMSALGLAVTAVVPNSDAAPAIVLGLLLPLAFLSNVFFLPELAPHWMQRVGSWLPLEPFVSALVATMTPQKQGWGPTAQDLVALAAWGLGALIVAIATFRWVPKAEGRSGTLTSRLPPARRVILILAALIVTLGVFAVDRGDEARDLAIVDADEVPESGVRTVTVDVPLDDVPKSIGFLGAPDTQALPMTVSLIGRGDQPPIAILSMSCPLLDIAGVDPAWLGRFASNRTGGDAVDPCSAVVIDDDGTCVGGDCFSETLLVAPTHLDHGKVVITPREAVPVTPREGLRPPKVRPVLGNVFQGTGSMVVGGKRQRIDGRYALITDPGLSLVGTDGTRIDLGSSSHNGGALDSISAGHGIDLGNLSRRFDPAMPFLAAGEKTTGPSGATVDRPDEHTWRLRQGRDFELVLEGEGSPLAWATAAIHLRDGKDRLDLDLSRLR